MTRKPEEMVEEVKEEKQDAWKTMVKMYIPRANYGGPHREEVFRVNNIGFCIFWNGTEQEVPLPIADIVKSAMAARAYEEDFRESLPKEVAPGVNI